MSVEVKQMVIKSQVKSKGIEDTALAIDAFDERQLEARLKQEMRLVQQKINDQRER
ncbi:hypothetical protein [Shewanella surugensis]|uniref:Uncharacterized protein n=1 Tax=Shewanella surugensis TaxID=212020 RepID=A0ABT0L7V1_9GAMM|nr:hypothetical protein [Shewanella surugensis]MCL1123746.1 hypothetical protein [Shewanella surugensis]